MSRAFFDQIDDELRGLLGPSLRDYHSITTSRLIKIWYDNPEIHFEVQQVSPRWSPTKKAATEVGLHLEAADASKNEAVLAVVLKDEIRWKKSLRNATSGPALGPRARDWRRLSEVLTGSGSDEDMDYAGELAELLATYVKALKYLLSSQATREKPRLGVIKASGAARSRGARRP